MSSRIKRRLTRYAVDQRRPDPLTYYFFALLFLALGVLGHFYNRHQIAEQRLQAPRLIAVSFVEAVCQGPVPRRTEGMHKTYVYTVPQDNGRLQPYRIVDLVWYPTKSACEADLPRADAIHPRTQAWYDAASPWNARWTLEEPSSISAGVWVAAAIGVCLLGLGWREQGRRQR